MVDWLLNSTDLGERGRTKKMMKEIDAKKDDNEGERKQTKDTK